MVNLITGINHMTISVNNIEESFAFYTETLDFGAYAFSVSPENFPKFM